MKKRSMVRTTLALLPAQIVFRAGEALLPLLLAYWFGRNRGTDVYYFAWAVFAFAGSLVFSAHQDSALVPVLAEERLARPKMVPSLLGSLLCHTWAIGAVLAAIVAGVALLWFRVRYEGPDFTLAATLVVPFALYLLALSTKTFLATLLAAEHHFVVQPIASSLGMVTAIGLMALAHDRFGIALVPVASLLAELVSIAALGYVALRVVGVKIELGFARSPALVRVAQLILPSVGGAAVTRINPVVDQLLAGFAGVDGGGTMLRYSGDVATLPTSLLQAALLPVLLSHLSDDFARRDLKAVRRTVTRTLFVVTAILLGVSILLYATRGPLLRFIFLRGEMDPAGVERMAAILPYHLVGLAPFGALLILARAHIAAQNSGIMIGMGAFNAITNAILDVVLVRTIGLEGIALATSGVHLAVACVFWFRFEGRLAQIESANAIQRAEESPAQTS